MSAGTFACSFCVEVAWPNKKPFMIFSHSFSVERKASYFDTEQAAKDASDLAIKTFIEEYHPDGTPLPYIVKKSLGSMIFIAEQKS
jgi:hypothetical protein